MMRAESPLISVIVAVYNGADTLRQCIDSVDQQTYQNKELIIIDGGSTDGTVDLLEKNKGKINYSVSEPDDGLYNAWNKALAQAKGEWICFLGADDFFWDKSVLERIAVHLSKIPSNTRVAYGQIMLVTKDCEALYPYGEPWMQIKSRFRQLMCLPHQGTFHRRSLFDVRGVFDESFKIAGDYELLYRELTVSDAHFIPDITVAGMRQGGGISSTPENSMIVLREIRRIHLKHGCIFPKSSWMLGMLKLYFRMFLWKVLGESRARYVLDAGRRLLGLPAFWTKVS